MEWYGVNAGNTAFALGARMLVTQNGTAGATYVPARFDFRTSDGTSFPENRLVIDSNGQVGIGVTPTSRNNTRLQIVDGIGFPSTQVASSDANTLDDYEEGTWTPTLAALTGLTLNQTQPTLSYANQTGRYTKVGRLVTLDFYIRLSSSGNTAGTGSLAVGGVPFAFPADALHGQSGSVMYAEEWGTSSKGAPIGVYAIQGTSYMFLRCVDSTASSRKATGVDTARAEDVKNDLIVAGTITHRVSD